MLFPDASVLSALMAKFLVGTLLFIRVMALMYSGPVFSSMGIDGSVRVVLSAMVALSMTMVYGGSQPPVNIDAGMLAVTALKEVMVGSLLGYTASLMMQAARFAGGLVDTEVGFQTALMFDPNAGVPTLVGEIYSLVMTMLLFAVNGHHFILEAVFASARIVPIDGFVMGAGATEMLIRLITSTMIIGLKIASPVIVAIFLTNVSLALLARVAPQMNIFTLSMHLKIIVGILALFVTMPLVAYFMKQIMSMFQSDLMKILMAMAPPPVP
jgi:flagellar biosynthetic protein FliR